MRDEIEQFRRADVRPFGVNPASVQDHQRYAAKLRLPFPLLSDQGLEISRSYRTLRPDGSGIARSVCLVDRGGIVRVAMAGAPGADLILEGLGSS